VFRAASNSLDSASRGHCFTVAALAAAVFAGGLLGAAGVAAFAYWPGEAARPRADLPCASALRPGRLTLRPVAQHDLAKALDTMGLEHGHRRTWLEQPSQRPRLLWLTVWDWDPESGLGDRVRISSGDYGRSLTLRSHRQEIAIPEPRSGRIEITGEAAAGDFIAASVLSGVYPVAIPYMSPGETVTIEIDAAHP
jgi:hypothetical protein